MQCCAHLLHSPHSLAAFPPLTFLAFLKLLLPFLLPYLCSSPLACPLASWMASPPQQQQPTKCSCKRTPKLSPHRKRRIRTHPDTHRARCFTSLSQCPSTAHKRLRWARRRSPFVNLAHASTFWATGLLSSLVWVWVLIVLGHGLAVLMVGPWPRLMAHRSAAPMATPQRTTANPCAQLEPPQAPVSSLPPSLPHANLQRF